MWVFSSHFVALGVLSIDRMVKNNKFALYFTDVESNFSFAWDTELQTYIGDSWLWQFVLNISSLTLDKSRQVRECLKILIFRDRIVLGFSKVLPQHFTWNFETY